MAILCKMMFGDSVNLKHRSVWLVAVADDLYMRHKLMYDCFMPEQVSEKEFAEKVEFIGNIAKLEIKPKGEVE